MLTFIKNALVLIPLVMSFTGSAVWIKKADFGGVARHRCTAFSIGSRGYVGLGHVNSSTHIIYSDFWEYSPATDSWSQKANYAGGQVYQCSAFTLGNYAYVGLGRDVNDVYVNDFYKYDPITNTWTTIATFPGEERRGAATFVINGEGYVGLGQSNNGYEEDFYRYNANTDTWHVIADFIGAARTAPASFANNGLGYIGTGHTWGAALKDFYEYDPILDQWRQLADVGDTLRQDAMGFVVNGKGYIGTGNNVDGSINYGDMWSYDFSTGVWTKEEDFTGFKRRFMVSFVIGRVAYCATGTNGTNFRDTWAFDPILSDNDLNDFTEVKTYPNPTSNNFTIESSNAQIINEVSIYNMGGQLIQRIEGHKTSVEINCSDWERGSYLISYKLENNQTSVQKVILN